MSDVFRIAYDKLAKRVQRVRARMKRVGTEPPHARLFLFPSASAFESYFALVRSAKRTLDIQMYAITHDKVSDSSFDHYRLLRVLLCC